MNGDVVGMRSALK